MESLTSLLLSLIVFLPAAGALVLAFFPRDQADAMKKFSLAITAVVFLLTADHGAARPRAPGSSTEPWPRCRRCSRIPWIPTFNINYFMGVDGISFPLVMLTSFVTMLSMAASWPIEST